jgi:hypothetical protein
MDRIRRRQISARPFLCPEKIFNIRWWNWKYDSVWNWAGEHWKCHGFEDRNIHVTATGNLFFSFSGIGEYSHLHNEPVSMYIGLLLNGRIIGSDFTEETTSYYHSVKRGPLSIQSTLKLNEGDEVWLRIYRSQGYIYLLEDGETNTSVISRVSCWRRK